MSPADASRWAHEARVSLEGVQTRFTATSSLSGSDCMNLYRGTEKLFKAVQMVKTGTYTRTHSLAALAQKGGFWSTLGSEHQATVTLLERYGAFANYPDDPGYYTLTNSTSRLDAARLLAKVSSLFAFVEPLALTANP